MQFEMSWTSTLVLIAGQLSFIFGAASFWSKDLLRLRLWQAASGVLGIGFNSYLMVSGLNVSLGLGSVVFWLAVFLFINLYRTGKMLADRLEVPLPADHKALFSSAFPMMHSKDVAFLLSTAVRIPLIQKHGEWSELELLPESIYLVEEGSCLIQRPTVGFISLQRGDLIGGISFLSHSATAEKGPLKIIEQGSILRWDLALMRKITEEDPQLEAALTDGFARQFSDDFLKGDEGALRDARTGHLNLSNENLQIHADFFPFLTQFQLLRLIESGERIELKPQDTSSFDCRLMCVYEGNVNVYLQDQDNGSMTLQPPDGILFLAQNAARRLSIQGSQQGAKLICWKDEVLDAIEFQEPRMYIGLIKSILERKRESQNSSIA